MYTNILLPTDGLGKCKFGTCHGVLLAQIGRASCRERVYGTV